jgi:hypothetical protein
MELVTQLAGNGILGLLLAISITANIYLFFKIVSVYDKRIEDGNGYRDAFVATSRDMINSQENIQKTLDTIATVVQNRV